MKVLTRTIWMLSLVSLFTDMASEMLYPIMPVFLSSIGFSYFLIGLLEGVAEATAGLSKSYFGKRSDITGRRLPFVQLGYSLSAISKPMMAAFITPLWIFLARTLDRLGKGLRTSARDAMLSDECTKENKARVFGFHRSMDTIGAVLGPSLALLFLYYYPGQYRTLFLVAFFPGVAAIILTLLTREKRIPPNTQLAQQRGSFLNIFSYYSVSSGEYKRLLAGLLFFAAFNSSDAFLLLKIKEAGLSDRWVIATYILYNLAYVLLAYPIGILADRKGIRNIFLFGLSCFALVYAGFAINHGLVFFFALFFLYAVYAASTEGISKAWISRIVPGNETASAIGTYAGLQSIAALVASSLTGFLWFRFGSQLTFFVTSGATILVILYFILMYRKSSVINDKPTNNGASISI